MGKKAKQASAAESDGGDVNNLFKPKAAKKVVAKKKEAHVLTKKEKESMKLVAQQKLMLKRQKMAAKHQSQKKDLGDVNDLFKPKMQAQEKKAVVETAKPELTKRQKANMALVKQQ